MLSFELNVKQGGPVTSVQTEQPSGNLSGKPPQVPEARPLAAHEQARFLAALVERSSQPIVVADRNRRILTWNAAFLELTGYSAEQMDQLSSGLSLTPPEWQEVEQDAVNRLVLTGQPQRYEKEYVRADGTRVPVEILRHVSFEPRGEIEYYFSFVTDISIRKRAEAELKQAFAALKDSEERNRIITSSISESVWLMDFSFRITYASPSVVKQSGYTPEELVSLPLERMMAPGSLALVLQLATEEITPEHLGAPSYGVNRTLELEMRHKSGASYWLEATFTLVRDLRSQPTGILAVGREITERKVAEERLLAATAALKESEERFRAVVQTATDAIFTFNLKGEIIFWNDAAERLFGYKPDEIKGRSFTLLLPEADRAAQLDSLEKLVTTDRLRENNLREAQARHRDGRLFPVEVSRALWRASGELFITEIVRDITERRRAQEQLRFQAGLLAQASDSIIYADLDNTILSWNRGAEDLYGWTGAEAVGRKATELLKTELPEDKRRQVMPLLLDKGVWTGDLVAYRRDGARLNIFTSRTLIRGPDGRPAGTVSVTRDVTERVQAEEKLRLAAETLRASEERFRVLAETATDGIISFDEEDHVFFWNSSAERMFGYKAEEAQRLTGRDFLFLPVDPSERNQTRRKQIEFGTLNVAAGRLLEATGIRKGGDTFPVEFSLALWKAGGRTNVTAIIRDVTRRRRREQLLRDSEERYRSLIDMAPDAIFSVDRNFRLTQWNKAAQKLFGYSTAEVLGQEALLILPERFHELARETYHLAFEKGVLPFGGSMPAIGKHKDGSEIPLEAAVGWHKAGDDLYLTQMSRDVSERLKAENEIRRVQAQAVQADKLAAIGRLAFSVAHEVNNPLTVMLMSVSFLLEDTPEGDPRRPDLQSIHNEIMRIRTLVKGLLDFSRPSEGRIARVDLKDILQTTLALVAKSMEIRGITPRLDLPTQALLVNADRSQLTQVFHNLLINAMEAMPKGGSITITADVTGSAVTLHFTDTGSGISLENQKSIFEPFFTTKRDTGGTGLGLSISRNILERFGGTIGFVSTPGQGATFIVMLPAASPPGPGQDGHTAV
jgi:PAS domain S-box-containing protein